jgi:membrane-bound ClpP family serine protease
MNWPVIFLGCFVVGFMLSALSVAFGVVDAHVHFPWETHVHADVLHGGHVHGVGPINFATMTAFVAWFGGAGYLLTTEFRWLLLPTIGLSIFVGLCGAGIVFLFMAKVLWSPNENMQSADFHMVGVLGRLSQPIREGGVGELIYSHGGARKSCGARSVDGTAIAKGTEVVVTDYQRGIASVRRWTDLSAETAADESVHAAGDAGG